MCDGRDLRPLLLPNLEDLHHEGNGVIFFEPLVDSFGEHGGGEAAKRLPPFDLGVQNSLHIAAPRIAQDRAIAERSRTPLHAPLEPAEDSPFRDRCRRAPAELFFVDFFDRTTRPHDLLAMRGEEPHYLDLRKLWTPKRVIHGKRPGAAKLVPCGKGSTNRSPGVPCRRLYIDATKRGHSSDLAVGDGIHCAAAGESNIG